MVYFECKFNALDAALDFKVWTFKEISNTSISLSILKFVLYYQTYLTVLLNTI